MQTVYMTHRRAGYLTAALGVLTVLLLLMAGGSSVQAAKGKEAPTPHNPTSAQIIAGFPMTITVEDSTQMIIKYTNPNLNQSEASQFYGDDAEGVYLWLNVGGATKVFGPAHVPAGNSVNPYDFISNNKTGSGTPSDPWTVTTVVGVPGTNVHLTQIAKYVNGAEFVQLTFSVAQIGGSSPMTATLFHAADLYTAGSDSGYGFYDASTGGVGDYFTPTNRALYQQFVPSTPASHFMENTYSTIWDQIGDTTGPGGGFNNTVISNTLHDSGAGLQWNLTVPGNGGVTIGDTDLFSPHQALCGSFSDVHYYDYGYDYIYYLACHGIVSGYPDTTFRPQNNVSRGQLCKIVANSAGFNETPTGQLFQDVPSTSPYYPYIQRMATRGLISGYPCGGPGEPCVGPGSKPYFRVNANASRGQIAKIVANAKGLTGTPTHQTFTDVPTGNSFYLYIERLVAVGTMGGYTCGGVNPSTNQPEPCDAQNRPYFRPGNFATRAQTAKIDALTFFPTCCPSGPTSR